VTLGQTHQHYTEVSEMDFPLLIPRECWLETGDPLCGKGRATISRNQPRDDQRNGPSLAFSVFRSTLESQIGCLSLRVSYDRMLV